MLLSPIELVSLAGAVFLLFISVTVLWIRSRFHRVRFPDRAVRLLRRCALLNTDSPVIRMLHGRSSMLLESLLLLKEQTRLLRLSIPQGRLLPLLESAFDALKDADGINPDALAEILECSSSKNLDSTVLLAYPLLIAVTAADHFADLLEFVISDERKRHQMISFAARFSRAKQAAAELDNRRLSLSQLAYLTKLLSSQGDRTPTEALRSWLVNHGTDMDSILARDARQQLSIADELRRLTDLLPALLHFDWSDYAEEADPIHQLLLQDPAGIYPRMAQSARANVRLCAAQAARRFRSPPETVIAAALHLANRSEEPPSSSHVGYWFLTHDGLMQLRKQLRSYHGCLWLVCLRYHNQLRRGFLWGASIVSAFPFLHAGNPLFLLPVFLIVWGCVSRFLLSVMSHPRPSAPALDVRQISDDFRTLVVLHARTPDTTAALHALRHLWIVSHTFPDTGVDYLLIGDHMPRHTVRGMNDTRIHDVLADGVAALNAQHGGHFMYLQRSREPSAQPNLYAPRGGRLGAIRMVCRMIAQGECSDHIAYTTFVPNTLYRRYPFILMLDGHSRPTAGMLQALLGCAAHPLCMRTPTPAGAQGFSCFKPFSHGASDTGIRLIRPDAYLEAIDRILPEEVSGDWLLLSDALSGLCLTPSAHTVAEHSSETSDKQPWQTFLLHKQLWRTLKWLAPLVNTASGVTRSPLPPQMKTQLRERLRQSLVPVCQCALLLLAIARHDIAVLTISLFVPLLSAFTDRAAPSVPVTLKRCILLPTEAALNVSAIWYAFSARLRIRTPAFRREDVSRLELGSQLAMAALCILADLIGGALWLPSLLPAILFCMFPLIQHRKPHESELHLSEGDMQDLSSFASVSWQFLREQADHSPLLIPPDSSQLQPLLMRPATYSPETLGMYLAAVVAAKSIGLISSHEAGNRISNAADVLQMFLQNRRLPARSYTSDGLVAAPDVDTRACGLLLASLMTAAQALRTWLGELPADFHFLAARLDDLASHFALEQLYDPQAGLFYTGLDASGIGHEHISLYTDEALLLSLAACARGIVPAEHFFHLSRTRIQAAGITVPLTLYGDLRAALLPGLFIPVPADDAQSLIHLMQLHGAKGLWARACCAGSRYTPRLEYRQGNFGLWEIASGEPDTAFTFSPYAAALALPFAPQASLMSLRTMRQLGIFGPMGFCDSVTISRNGNLSPVFTYNAAHQAMILCSCAHVTADGPLQQFFCAIPTIAAALPLLRMHSTRAIILPPRPIFPTHEPRFRLRDRIAEDGSSFTAQLMGSPEASLCMSITGSSRMMLGSRFINAFSGKADTLEGFQVYVQVNGRLFRLTDPHLSGETTFSTSHVRFTRHCDSILACTTIFPDQTRERILCHVEITNQTDAPLFIEAADCLPTDGFAPKESTEVSLRSAEHLTCYDRDSGISLHHRFSVSVPISRSSVYTDSQTFFGSAGNLAAPSSLSQSMTECIPSRSADCAAFRMEIPLRSHEQASILFSVSLHDDMLPPYESIDGLLELAGLQAEAVLEACSAGRAAAELADQMTCRLIWQQSSVCFSSGQSTAEAPMILIELQDHNGLPRLRECLQAVSILRMRGAAISVCVLCTEETGLPTRREAERILPEGAPKWLEIHECPPEKVRDALWAKASLHFNTDSCDPCRQIPKLKAPADRSFSDTHPSEKQ